MKLLKLPGLPPNDEQCAQGSKYTLVMPIDIKAMMTVRGEIYRETNELYWHWQLLAKCRMRFGQAMAANLHCQQGGRRGTIPHSQVLLVPNNI